MNIIEKKIRGVFEITFTPANDERGYTMRTYDHKIFEYFNFHKLWVQEYQIRTEKKGVIRGMYFQHFPYSESKLIKCTRGAVFCAYADLRKNSPFFGKWESTELTEQNKKMVFVPKGFAAGICSLTELSEVVVKSDNYYHKDYESGIIWNDKDLNINWPTENPIISERDKSLPALAEYISKEKLLEGEL